MLFILWFFKEILAIWMLIIIANFFRSLCGVLLSVMKNTELGLESVIRAKELLHLGTWTASITVGVIYLMERMIGGGIQMVEKIPGIMYIFGIVFIVAAIVAAIAAFVAAMDSEQEGANMAKGLFKNCLFYAMLLWIVAWLIS